MNLGTYIHIYLQNVNHFQNKHSKNLIESKNIT